MSLRPKEVDFQAKWSLLHETVRTIISIGKMKRQEWNDRFSDVYELCVAHPVSFAPNLYDKTKKVLECHVLELYKAAVSCDEELLGVYYRQWFDFSQGIKYLNQLYFYFNTQFIRTQPNYEVDLEESTYFMIEMGELGLEIWKSSMLLPLQSKLVHLLLDGIRLDRHGVCPNQTAFHGVIQSFVQVDHKKKDSLKLYQDIFEVPFLKATSEHYQQEAGRLLQENNCSQYMEKVLQKLAEENFRSVKYLHPSSYEKVTQECEKRMVADHLEFLHSECKRMVQEENKKDMRNMYLLLKSNPSAIETLIQELEQHIIKIASEAIKALSGDNIPQEFVESLLAVHDKFSSLNHEVFSDDHQFTRALDKAYTVVINRKENSKQVCQSAELVAKHCDILLKKNSKVCSETELDNKLARTIIIFKYVDDKDLFQKFYSKMMAKRLIQNLSVSMDAEEFMINKLKDACGYEYTGKFHRMFTDVTLSHDLNSCFQEYVRKNTVELDVNFSISVLQAGSWPLGQSVISTFAIPQELERSVKHFESFYNGRFSGRRLTWLHHLCDAELKLCYLKRNYILQLSTYLMAVLLLYERADVLSYREISEHTKLSDDQLKRQILSLVESKLLLATENGKPIEADSLFSLNKEYKNKRMKFRLLAVAQKETAQKEAAQTLASVNTERKLFLKAAIVRIMKERKVLRHNNLIQEVINQAKNRFSPNVSMIKKCIEELIEKEYIERTPNSTDEYSYVA